MIAIAKVNQANAVKARHAATLKKKPSGVDPVTSEIEYSADDWEFMKAVQDYKGRTGRQFPTLRETLGVLKSLGYAKPTAEACAPC